MEVLRARPEGWEKGYFGYKAARISPGVGSAAVEVAFGGKEGPESLSTEEIEVFMYLAGEKAFFSKEFSVYRAWAREGGAPLQEWKESSAVLAPS